MNRELQPLLDEWAREAGVPGASVGILHDGEESLLTTGVSSVDTGQAVEPGTLFMIGSTSKTFTAAAVLALVEDGVLDLDEPVAKYLPELRLADPVARDTITTRHLLTHSAGFLGDVDIASGWGSDALAAAAARFDELPQVFGVGEVFSYSNSGFLLAGRVAEVVSGLGYEDLVRERLLEPLDMTDSWFLPWDVLTRPHAVGHVLRDGKSEVAHDIGLTRSLNPGGGLWSTAADQLRWARFLLTGQAKDAPPLSDATRALWRTPQRAAACPIEQIALGWMVTRHGDAEIVRHGGNVSNLQLSDFITVPAENFAVTVLTNGVGGGVLGPKVVDWCLENLAGLPALEAKPVVPTDPAEYAGSFPTGDLGFEFTVRDGGLWARMVATDGTIETPPAFEVAFVAEDVVARAADTRRPLARFLRDEHGEVSAVEFGLRTAQRERSRLTA
ncbi:CubicO group peptidase, beta-lactamase class C family [Amycolatopsis xylanica]|uniref:CubicO group peptidase, beta-lactamase class C family n=1 Tax=Amycolatopsis xylanica TaxID=589385 RepID=A0A1H3RI33_9PSEU|nr:serine hydrolase domain-containing protein [Amycolatopsis xylanica]SDZ25243.1 CubicO group peptidase, beta-lactamase class C family [Amycolatopsis xylanica]